MHRKSVRSHRPRHGSRIVDFDVNGSTTVSNVEWGSILPKHLGELLSIGCVEKCWFSAHIELRDADGVKIESELISH